MKSIRITREDWIDAYSKVRDEYEMDVHYNSQRRCSKCNIVFTNCTLCSEHVFKPSSSGSCMYRQCEPMMCSHGEKYDRYKPALLEYHDVAIKWLTTIKHYSLKRFKAKLLRIDNEVAKKYNL